MTFCFPGQICPDLSDHAANDSVSAGCDSRHCQGNAASIHSSPQTKKEGFSSSVVDSKESSSGWNV